MPTVPVPAPSATPTSKPLTAFVLSGGASLGAAQVGMLRALLERHIMPDLIVGTSIGSWNGLWLAANPSIESLDALEQVWKSVTLFEVLGGNALDIVSNRAYRRPYLVTAEGMRKIFQRAASAGNLFSLNFEDLPIPFRVTATNLMTGTSETFASGPVAQPVFASSAIPGLFPPVVINHDQYVDGGLLDNGGVQVAIDAGATRIYVMNVMYGGRLPKPVNSLGELILRSLHIVASNHVHAAVERNADRAEFILIEDDSLGMVNALDFGHTTELFQSGYRAAMRKLDEHERFMAARAANLTIYPAHSPPQSLHDIIYQQVATFLGREEARAAMRGIATLEVGVRRLGENLRDRIIPTVYERNGTWIALPARPAPLPQSTTGALPPPTHKPITQAG